MKQELIIINAPDEVAQGSFNALLNLNKKSIESVSAAIEESVSEGHEDALKALILAKKLQELGKAIESKTRDIAMDDSKLAKGEVYKTLDVEVTQRESGVRYNYSKCGHPAWERANSAMKEAKADLAEIEKTLKTISRKTTIIDDDTGEIAEINPPIRSGKLGLVLTLK